MFYLTPMITTKKKLQKIRKRKKGIRNVTTKKLMKCKERPAREEDRQNDDKTDRTQQNGSSKQ